MAQPGAAETSARTYSNIRLIVTHAVANGFPIDRPASVYIDGRPSAVQFV